MTAENPHVGKVVDLVNPYMTQESNNAGGGRDAEGGEYAIWWLTSHPGRWALVAEDKCGIPLALLQKAGFRTSMIGKNKRAPGYRLYAQLPHPEAEDLKTALARTAAPRLELPLIQASDFGWTPAELADAVYVMRENLFPAMESMKAPEPEPEPTARGGKRGRPQISRIRS